MSSAPSALITGITGQDGSFLVELLLEKGYTVTGLIRPGSAWPTAIDPLRERIQLLEGGDLLDSGALSEAIAQVRPSEIYHLAAPSFVPASWQEPGATMRAIVGSCATILETVRDLGGDMRVFISASGAMFGEAGESPQREQTPCRPTTPYAIAKLAAHELVGAMRSHYGLHASSGIVFNHESERRPEQFVTRRITHAAAAISLGLQDEVTLGSLDAVRDWSFAGDIVEGAWLMLQQEEPDDYVLASGVARTVAELARTAFACVGLEADRYLRLDDALVRAPERTASVGDAGKARKQLGWAPRLSFEALIERMVRADLALLQTSGLTR